MQESRLPGPERHQVDLPAPPRRHSVAARALGRVFAWALRLLSATWRIEMDGIDVLDAAWERGDKVLVVFWHGKYVPLFPLLAGRPGCVFSSLSFRGDVVAEICRRFGFNAVQIPDDGGETSLRLMYVALSGSRLGAMAVDGPLGPRHEVHGGAIRLASALGFALVPVSVAAARRHIRKKRWDKMEVPAPVTRIRGAFGGLIRIPSDLGEHALPAWKSRIAGALTELDQRTEGIIDPVRAPR